MIGKVEASSLRNSEALGCDCLALCASSLLEETVKGISAATTQIQDLFQIFMPTHTSASHRCPSIRCLHSVTWPAGTLILRVLFFAISSSFIPGGYRALISTLIAIASRTRSGCLS